MLCWGNARSEIMLKFIRNFLNGLAFGITETIPGVSGGTIAIILGFYFDLIETVNHFTENVKKYLTFLTPILLGMITGLLVFSSIIHYLLSNYSFPTMLFFIGLITGIIPHIFARVLGKMGTRVEPQTYGLTVRWGLGTGEDGKREEGGKGGVLRAFARNVREKISISVVFLVLVPFAGLVVLSFLNKDTATVNTEVLFNNVSAPYMLFIFFAGILAAAALVIPGISGSFVLLLLGIYHLAIYTLSTIKVYFADVHNTELLINICKVLIPLVIGLLVGGLSMARLIEKLMEKHHKTMYSAILGLLSGSVFFLFRHPIVYKSGVSAGIIAAGVITFMFGCVVSFLIGKKRL